jgi:hypothetical protein
VKKEQDGAGSTRDCPWERLRAETDELPFCRCDALDMRTRETTYAPSRRRAAQAASIPWHMHTQE